MDGADRTGRAEILALAAADAAFLDYARDERGLIVSLHLADHRNGSHRAMRGTCSATHAFRIRNTQVVIDGSAADVDHGFFFLGNRENGTGGTDLRAVGALRTAEAAVEIHLGLHQVTGIGAGTEHIVGAVGDAQLARGAMLVEVLRTLSSRRDDALRALRSLLGKDGGQAAVVLLALLGVKQGGSSRHQRSQHKRALASIGGLWSSFGLGLLAVGETVIKRAFRTLLDAVEADDAARAVDRMRLTVDAGGLAVLVAFAAGDALALVDGHAEQREARDKTESSTHGANIVAPRTPVGPREISHAGQSRKSNQRHNPADRMDDARDYAAVCAVRCDKGYKNLDAKYQAENENTPDTVAHSLVFRLVAEGLAKAAFKFGYGLARSLRLGGTAGKALHLELPERAADPQDKVLIHAERTDD